eukprot:TRINITY_DN28286_c0_g2_i1.p1 TRINITY_DN28286_c0_g2~~TRINITY_DN28286_c0_g2_i1.p1  ORF type:complete len:347 (+),score=45.41 TRINITY_DN28286_c0_g2_i1:74-1042(+)
MSWSQSHGACGDICRSHRARRWLMSLVLVSTSGWTAHLAALASDASKPHPHQGLVPRFKLDGKPQIQLSSEDLARIDAGELWTRSFETEQGVGSGFGIRDVAAPPEVVFGQISDVEGYVGKVPMLKSIEVYAREPNVVKAAYRVKVLPGYHYEYYVEHYASARRDALLFHLDYDRRSDFSDMQGKWFLEAHPTKPGWTRVHYQCDLLLFGYAPRMVKSLLTTQGLESAIGWVKRESEARAAPADVQAASTTAFLHAGRSWRPSTFAWVCASSIAAMAAAAVSGAVAALVMSRSSPRRPREVHRRQRRLFQLVGCKADVDACM